jgi:hypothetical protein
MSQYFPSKIDWWFYLIIGGLVAAFAFSAYTALVLEPEKGVAALPGLAIAALFGVGLPVWLIASTGYTLEPTVLRIKSGPFSWNVPVVDIRSITPTRNPLSSPALSLDRLKIEHARGWVMISPADKEGFLRALDTARGKLDSGAGSEPADNVSDVATQ